DSAFATPPAHALKGIPAARSATAPHRGTQLHQTVRRVRLYTPAGSSATLGRELRVRSLPHGPRRSLMVASRQAGGRRRPHVAARRERAALGACALKERVDILASHAKGAADAHRRQDTVVDPVADRLGG